MATIDNKSFVSFDNKINTILFDDTKDEKYPIKYHNLVGYKNNNFLGEEGKSYFVYVYNGSLQLTKKDDFPFILGVGNFFSISGIFSLSGLGQAVIIEVEHQKEGSFYLQNNFSSMFQLGRIEEKGRLKYIDGCTDSLLIAPIKLGDPCFNHLHFPKDIDQTMHTHPSHRIGIVAKGHGLCKTPFGNVPLNQGMIFVIKKWDGVSYSIGLDGKEYPDGLHSFQTFDSFMDVIAFHPDSDYGPTDETHPMINKTIVDGISASKIEEIRTK